MTPEFDTHPQTDEHLAACPECMLAHDEALPDEEEDSISLLEIIRAAAKAYEGSYEGWDELINDHGFRNGHPSGDGLVDFIIVEISETYDPGASRDDQLFEARRVIERGQDQLGDVLDKLLSLS